MVFIDCDLPYFKSIYSIIKYLKINDMVIVNRRKHGSKLKSYKLNFYQLMRIFLGYSINNFIRIWFNINIRDTQAGLKGFVKPKNFSRIKFISKRFFFDLELILLFYFSKKHYGIFYAYRKTLKKFISALIKLIFYYFFNKKKYLIYKHRFLGLLNSYLGRKSSFRVIL